MSQNNKVYRSTFSFTYVIVKLYRVTPSHRVPSNRSRYRRLTSLSQPPGGAVEFTTEATEFVRFDVMEKFTAELAVVVMEQAGML